MRIPPPLQRRTKTKFDFIVYFVIPIKNKNQKNMENITKNNRILGKYNQTNLCISIFLLLFVCMAIFSCHSKEEKNVQTNKTKKTPEPQFFLNVVSEDYMQDEMHYVPRFVKGKNIIYIAWSFKGDSVLLFSPYKKMTDEEYNKWLGRSKAAYEYVTGKVVE